MGVPVSQMWTVASYVLGQKLRGRKRYPLVLMLEPLFRCNLACAGCGKIQYPSSILKQHLSVEDCLKAVDECGAPIVSIPGGEPLLHPEMDKVVEGIVARGKYVYLCTNAILLKKHLHRYKPDKHLSFSVHLDGPREDHDLAVCREGIYDIAIEAIRETVNAGFRVTTNTTVFNHSQPERLREMFDTLMEMGVEGMMISPGYQYEKAPDQEHFLNRNQTVQLFRKILGNPKKTWTFNQSPLFIEFLKGNWQLECTPWGNPTYNLFGWQKPCYLLQDGYASTFQELMETTDWDAYGRASGNSRCQDCMVHCGYEPSAVNATFGTVSGLMTSALRTLFGPGRDKALPAAPAPAAMPVSPPSLVSLQLPLRVMAQEELEPAIKS
ncbi:adenosyl-hopene transferase HpnH [Planctomicrobium piriforme]|uniref:Hopanoid biosynthesis associated radical SAM protein HpnH n=1 Tax=Planctomicrobium piriforme TaxID=1576369 RepID=A0A1I3HTP7_9PLAN|nr:adenosyl-hopene transferase HpnH [Planctomicrobium piriforme]SFI39031.1 hopanoid biosynthesis associated radical SAM protein HpnH [Planctomicrobium piriforme]